jgi:hypothetical protein
LDPVTDKLWIEQIAKYQDDENLRYIIKVNRNSLGYIDSVMLIKPELIN